MPVEILKMEKNGTTWANSLTIQMDITLSSQNPLKRDFRSHSQKAPIYLQEFHKK